jgi:hypothetical protein
LPGTKLLEEAIVTKRDKKNKWVEVDISKYNIMMPREGIFIVFKTLDQSHYKTKIIASNLGMIDAVPALGIVGRKGGRKSFISLDGVTWEEQGKVYEMDILLEK